LKRSLIFRAVDLITGKVVNFDEKSSLNELALGIQGSASIPFFFPPVEVNE
jgi:predicted acylesterase/phospholipase RssA